jgi:hypothetical protein
MSEVLTVLRPNGDALIANELAVPLERRIFTPLVEAGVPLPSTFLTDAPRPLDWRYTPRNTTLVAAHPARDPVAAAGGGLIPAPPEVRRQLAELRNYDPDLLWVVRELPGRWEPGQEPPRMIGVETRRENEQLHLQAAATAFTVGRTLLYVAAGVVLAAVGAPLALGAAVLTIPLAVGVDPIVLGGIVHPETGAVAWVPLAAWDEVPDDSR